MNEYPESRNQRFLALISALRRKSFDFLKKGFDGVGLAGYKPPPDAEGSRKRGQKVEGKQGVDKLL